MTDARAYEAARIRLRILEGLAAQPGKSSWSLAMIAHHLAALGYRKSDDYILNQLRWLETEVLAVRLIDAGVENIVVVLRSAGRQHVEGARELPGVHPPRED